MCSSLWAGYAKAAFVLRLSVCWWAQCQYDKNKSMLQHFKKVSCGCSAGELQWALLLTLICFVHTCLMSSCSWQNLIFIKESEVKCNKSRFCFLCTLSYELNYHNLCTKLWLWRAHKHALLNSVYCSFPAVGLTSGLHMEGLVAKRQGAEPGQQQGEWLSGSLPLWSSLQQPSDTQQWCTDAAIAVILKWAAFFIISLFVLLQR